MNQTSLPPFDIGEHHLFVLTLKRIVQQDRLILEWSGSVVPLIEGQGIFIKLYMQDLVMRSEIEMDNLLLNAKSCQHTYSMK